ncbi:MAG: hypothetical protein H0W06_11850 [Chloroflexia bacterium]|nr:hypothetical protein [Chloroflexia bacterium]
MWINHHAIFRVMASVDQTVTFANGLLLMLVTAVPFATEIVAEFLTTDAASAGVALYAGLFALVSLAYNLLWWRVARRGRRLDPNHDPRATRTFSISLLLGLPLNLTAAAVAFWNPYTGFAICTTLWLFWSITPFDPLPNDRDE